MISHQEKWQRIKNRILSSDQYPPALWNVVETYAESLLEQGRPNFDVPYTHAVVAWMYEITHKLKHVDIPTVITTAWLHDIGYFGQFNWDALDFPRKPKTLQRFDLFTSVIGRSALQAAIERFEQFIIQRDFAGTYPRL